jgi:hypothetical protein
VDGRMDIVAPEGFNYAHFTGVTGEERQANILEHYNRTSLGLQGSFSGKAAVNAYFPGMDDHKMQSINLVADPTTARSMNLNNAFEGHVDVDNQVAANLGSIVNQGFGAGGSTYDAIAGGPTASA